MNDKPIFQTHPLEGIQDGMTVVDATGQTLGKVARVGMGDPGAVTTSGQSDQPGRTGLIVAPTAGNDEDQPDLPEPLRTQIRRAGFVEVDGPGLDGPERFIPGDRIAEVTGGTVQLRPAVDPRASVSPPQPAAVATVSFAPSPSSSVTPAEASGTNRRQGPRQWLVVGSGVMLAVSAAAGAWLYRRRQAQARPTARLKRGLGKLARSLRGGEATSVGALGAGLLLTLLLRKVARTSRRESRPRSDVVAATSREKGREDCAPGQWRFGMPLGLVAGAVGLGVIALRQRAKRSAPDYIGTPGVESAAGRDRTRTGELPPEFGVEHPHG